MLLAKMRAPHTGDIHERVTPEMQRLVGHLRIDNFDFTKMEIFQIDELMQTLGLELPDVETPKLVDYDLGTVVAALHEAVDTVLVEYRRDIVMELFGLNYYLLTGGLSWGDPPTDSFDHVWSLDWIDLFEEPITQDELDAVATKEPQS